MKKSELFFSALMIPVDILAIIGSFAFAYILRVKIDPRPIYYLISGRQFLGIIAVLIPIWIFIFVVLGLYNLRSTRRKADEFAKIVVGVSGSVMTIIFVDFLNPTPIFPSKLIVVYGWIFAVLFVTLGRQVILFIQRYLFKYRIGKHHILVIGANETSRRVLEEIDRNPGLGYDLLGVLDNKKRPYSKFNQTKVLGSVNKLTEIHKKKWIDEVIQTDPSLKDEELFWVINFCEDNRITFRYIPSLFNLYAVKPAIIPVGGIPIVELRQTPLEGWGRIIKRSIDIIISLIGLIILSPLFITIYFLVRIESSHRSILKQKRVGLGEKIFYMYKFETFYQKNSSIYPSKSFIKKHNKAKGPRLVFKKDPRLTKFGNFLRKTSLNELPQLINVLKGDMSLVGPRPPLELEVEQYNRHQKKRLNIKPGITGWWQIMARGDLDFEQVVKFDTYYMENWSLILDLKIMFKTFIEMVKGKGK